MIILKCSKCHHEAEGVEQGGSCSWCNEGVMERIGETPTFDPYQVLERLQDVSQVPKSD